MRQIFQKVINSKGILYIVSEFFFAFIFTMIYIDEGFIFQPIANKGDVYDVPPALLTESARGWKYNETENVYYIEKDKVKKFLKHQRKKRCGIIPIWI